MAYPGRRELSSVKSDIDQDEFIAYPIIEERQTLRGLSITAEEGFIE